MQLNKCRACRHSALHQSTIFWTQKDSTVVFDWAYAYGSIPLGILEETKEAWLTQGNAVPLRVMLPLHEDLFLALTTSLLLMGALLPNGLNFPRVKFAVLPHGGRPPIREACTPWLCTVDEPTCDNLLRLTAGTLGKFDPIPGAYTYPGSYPLPLWVTVTLCRAGFLLRSLPHSDIAMAVSGL